METHNKLLEQFKDAAAQDETKPFAASEKVWQQIEGKLDNNNKKFIPLLRYASIAAVILLLSIIGIVMNMQLRQPRAPGKELAQNTPVNKMNNKTIPEIKSKIETNNDTEIVAAKEKVAYATDKMKTVAPARSQSAVTGHIAARQVDKIPVTDVIQATESKSTGNRITMQELQAQVLRQERYTYTDAVSAIPAEQLEKQPVTNIIKALEGAAPGIQVTNGSGQPGTSAYQSEQVNSKSYMNSGTDSVVIVRSDMGKRRITDVTKAIEGAASGMEITSNGSQPDAASSVSIRGYGSMSAGDAPLIVVDGIAYNGDLSMINPKTIKNITVLKDASATSLYGARAANGAIIITTKDGKGIKERRRNFLGRLFGKRHKD